MYIINFVGLFLALYLSDLILEIISINLWLIDMGIRAVVVITILLGKRFERGIYAYTRFIYFREDNGNKICL